MAENSKIEWTDHTWSPWEGCTKISPACDHCYAARMNGWLKAGNNWGPGAPRLEYGDEHWKKPIRWAAKAQNEGTQPKVFPSVCDPFDNEVRPELRAKFFDLIYATQPLTWLLLTKRIGNVKSMLQGPGMPGRLPSNVWLGATICNQVEAERDIPKLQDIQATVRFLSVEPMLGPITIGRGGAEKHGFLTRKERDGREGDEWWTYADYPLEGLRSTKQGQYKVPRIDWVICGGESGPKARPMHPDWPTSLRDQCAAAGVPFLFKQFGEWRPPMEGEEFNTAMGHAQKVPAFIVAPEGTVHCFENERTKSGGKVMLRVGKKAAGRLLDGRTHDQFPESV